MAGKVSKEEPEKRKVTFKVRAPDAKEVQLVGDFNNWDPNSHPMGKDEEGFWKIGLRLAPGRYEYKLLVDGRWWEDIREPNNVRNPFGTLNKVLVVPAR
jgi:1,4-alpha-glucan branching enzyme